MAVRAADPVCSRELAYHRRKSRNAVARPFILSPAHIRPPGPPIHIRSAPAKVSRQPDVESPSMVNLADIRAAAERIAPHVRRTPLLPAPAISERLGRPAYLKPEFWQDTGSFKVRGAANYFLAATGVGPVITASTGNHGQAVARMAQRLGVRAVVAVPEGTPQAKVGGIRRFGAELREIAGGYDAAHAVALEMAAAEGLRYVPAFEDDVIIAGQGTIGLEIARDLPDVAEVFVPVGGGGLAAGIGAALAEAAPTCRLRGAQSVLTPGMARSLAAGAPVAVPEPPTLCDGLAGGVDALTLGYAERFLNGIDLVEETEVAAAMCLLALEERWIVEGSAAVALAAALRSPVRGGPVVVVLTGRNVDGTTLSRILAEAT